ncbi:MAG: alpha/beta hydrolase [Acidobacteriaceae bacterium]|nr:alpha/beta hydrolase [Acidobacteriaceae bacterium]
MQPGQPGAILYPATVTEHQVTQQPNCEQRVTEIHRLLNRAEISGPYVVVGFSLGGVVARLYSHDYPEEVAGMVIIDHAFIDVGSDSTPVESPTPDSKGNSPPVLISKTPITLGIEDDLNFGRLPPRGQELHRWAMSNHPARPTAETAAECVAAVERATNGQTFPLGDKPLIVIQTRNDALNYAKLQSKLMALSRDSQLATAEDSTHMVIIDRPDVIVSAIRRVVDAVRTGTRLQ